MFLRGKQQGLGLPRIRYTREIFRVLSYSLFAIIFIGIFIPFGDESESVGAVTDLTGDHTVTITSASTSATVSVVPSSSGTFATTSGNGNIRFSVATNNYSGYTLAARSSKTTLDNGGSSLQTLSSSVTSAQFELASNTSLNNRWGYKPNYYNSQSNSNYYGISTASTTLDTTSAANTTAKNYNISLGARVDLSVPSGTYLNENLILECTANYIPSSTLTVNYGNHVTGVSIGGTSIPNGGTVTLIRGVSYAISMTTEDYFTDVNWSSTSGSIGSSSSSSTTYTISSSDATLSTSASFAGPTIQNLSAANCTTTLSYAIDSRDDHIYPVKRLSDGNCWMMGNLDLGRTALTTDLTSSNTNLSSTIYASTFNGWKKTTGVVDFTNGAFISITGTDSTSANPYGTLYNYYAASAATVKGPSSSVNAFYDICPAGWRMPTGSTGGEYETLYSYYNSYNSMRASAAQGGAAFSMAGAFLNSAPESQGESGIYWTSTYASGSIWAETQEELTMSELYLTEAVEEPIVIEEPTVYTNDIDGRYLGVSVRCVTKKPSHTLTVTYGTGVSNVTVNGVSIVNGGTITLEEGVSHPIKAFFNPNYNFSSWSATSGVLGSSSQQFTTYKIGSSNATLTITASTFSGNVMQNLNPTLCTTTETKVKDNRDNRVYAIKRLNDGNCWMIDSLKLGATALATDLTSSNTNISSTITASVFNGWRVSTPTSTYAAGKVVSNDGLDHYTSTEYGTLYNFYAASGGTISGNSNSNNASYDICPAGWRLPTGGSVSDFATLVNSYNTFRIHAPTSIGGAGFGFSGYSSGTSVTGKETYGYYWSSTRSNNTNMKYLSTSVSGPSYTGSIGRGYTATIKCILDQKTIGSLSYLQDFANLTNDEKTEVAASMADSTTYNLVDNRDSKTYTVAKLKDGRIWMAENLDLGRTTLSTNLTSSNTNLSSTVASSTFNGWKKTSGSLTNDAGEYISITGTDSTSNNPYATLYNYYAASAGTVIGSSHDYDALYDICPAGWRLPVGDSWGEIAVLYGNSAYNTPAKMRASIADGGAAFALAGYFSSSTPASQGTSGSYWSSMRSSSTNRYSSSISSSSVIPNGSSGRGYGRAVRCILKKSTYAITVSYGTGITSITINGVPVANNGTIQLEESTRYNITASLEPGYSFTSWSVTTGAVDTASSASTFYRTITSNGTVTATASFAGTYMQNLDSSSCTSTASTVYDSRDMHAYTIKRLNDGNCWMMENLDLGRTNLTTNLTSSNTNLSTTVTAATFNSWKKTAGSLTNDAGEFVPVSGTDAASGTAYGTHYNYYAASAGTITGSTNSGNAQYDICPAGWRLPTGGSSGELQALYAQYNSNALMRAPASSNGASFALAGSTAGAEPAYQESNGRYWSSTRYTDDHMYYLYLDTSSVSPSSIDVRYRGVSIRCVLKSTSITSLTYLQDFKDLSSAQKATVAASMADSTTYNLIDNRDNKTYKVAKMKDGNIWMAENLDLGKTTLSVNLTSSNTNLSTTVTAATFNSWKKSSGSSTYTSGEYIPITASNSSNGLATDPVSNSPYGTLYNYYAATAGTISNNTGPATYDICPAGWRLPVGGDNSEYQALYNYYNSYSAARNPITSQGMAVALSGGFTSSVYQQGQYARVWTKETNGTQNATYLMLIDSASMALPDVYGDRKEGSAIRCIAK